MSLLLAKGATVVEVVRQVRALPTVTLSTYAHVYEELEGTERSSRRPGRPGDQAAAGA